MKKIRQLLTAIIISLGVINIAFIDLSIMSAKTITKITRRSRTAGSQLEIYVPTVSSYEENLAIQRLIAHGYDPELAQRIHNEYAAGERPLVYLEKHGSNTGVVMRYDDGYVIDLSSLAEEYLAKGIEIIQRGGLAIIVLKGGAAMRWVGGGVDKGIVPMVFMPDGSRMSLVELHLRQIKEAGEKFGGKIQVVMSNSYLNNSTTAQYLEEHGSFGLPGDIVSTVDVGIGHRLIPNPKDLQAEFDRREEGMRGWERLVALSLLATEQRMVQGWVDTAKAEGAENPYMYQPLGMNQNTKLHPLGHFQVLPAMFLGGQLRELIDEGVEYLMIFNVDNLFNLEDMGVDIRPEVIGFMEAEGKSIATEFTDRGSDVGGVLAQVTKTDEDGNTSTRHMVLEGITSDPLVEAERDLDLINTATHYISIDGLLRAFGFESKEDFLSSSEETIRMRVAETVEKVERHTTIKRVSELLPDGREYNMPAVQVEQLLQDLVLLLGEEDWQPIYTPRIGEDGRFEPLKGLDTLTEIRTREGTIGAVGSDFLSNNPAAIVEIIKSSPLDEVNNVSDIELFSALNYNELLQVTEQLRVFSREDTTTHFQKLRSSMYLYVIFLDYLPDAAISEGMDLRGGVPTVNMLKAWVDATGTDDFMALESVLFDAYMAEPSLTMSSWLAQVHRRLTRETRQDQVEESMEENLSEFLGEIPYTLDQYEEHVNVGGDNAELKARLMEGSAIDANIGVRVELDSTVGSDVFGIAMDYPEGSHVINSAMYLRLEDPLTQTTSIEPPITVVVRKITDGPIVRLTSVDMGQSKEYGSWEELRDITSDDLGLLKAGLLATGVIPLEPLWKMEEAGSYLRDEMGLELSGAALEKFLWRPSEDMRRELRNTLRKNGIDDATIEAQTDVLFRDYVVGLDVILESFFDGEEGCGIEVITYVKDCAMGSGLAISSSLAAGLGSALLQFRGAIDLEGDPENYNFKEHAVAVAMRMEWLGISGGGYQDMAAIWGGMHEITVIEETDPNASTRAELIPHYETIDLSPEAKRLLEDSIVIAHLGMAQPVGPMLDILTDTYYLRRNWDSRKDSERLYDRQIELLKQLNEVAPSAMRGNRNDYEKAMNILREFATNMEDDYDNRRDLVPEATNTYGDEVFRKLEERFPAGLWGYNTTGCRAGAGTVFVIDPQIRDEFGQELVRICEEVKAELNGAFRISYDVKIYDWRIADEGVVLDVLSPEDTNLRIDWLEMARDIIFKMKNVRGR
ncbi:MAG: UTP--glucose-1-phosphate uridylyltransferase [Candidatus Kaelpia imicola]|nr:UTP--glucose-1-phosphate uridylyltransferase [Candidatus Kaelpia imicola]